MEKRHKEEEHENDERWLLTYADLITLLMVFFVVMYAISKADSTKFSAVSQSMAVAFGTPRGSVIPMPESGVSRYKRLKRGDTDEYSRSAPGVAPAQQDESLARELTKSAAPLDENGAPMDDEQRGAPLDDDKNESEKDRDKESAPAPLSELEDVETRLEHVAREVESLMRARGLEDMVELEQSEDGRQLTIRLRDSILFGRGGADITPGAHELIDRVGGALLEIGLPLTVAGHTDNIPIRAGGRFRSNWELSTARSTAVLVYMIDRLGFPPGRISAGGYGEYHPVASNDTREGRSQNRRVEFILTDDQVRPRTAASPEPPNYADIIPHLRVLSQAPLYVRL